MKNAMARRFFLSVVTLAAISRTTVVIFTSFFIRPPHNNILRRYAKMLVLYERFCQFQKQTDGFGKLRWYFSQSHSYEQNHLWDVSLFCEDRSWQNDFSNIRSRITTWVARFLLKRSWRTVPVARYLTNVSVCCIQLSKSCGESVLLSCKSRCRARKRGLNKSCSAVTACYSSSISKAISNPKIILIIASRINPFNSISTTI